MITRDLFKVCKGGSIFEYNLPYQQAKEEKIKYKVKFSNFTGNLINFSKFYMSPN